MGGVRTSIHWQLGHHRGGKFAIVCAVVAAAFAPLFAQTTEPSDTPTATVGAASAVSSGQPGGAEMMKQMMELAKLNENHKLLADTAGSWSYTVKFWQNPGAPPQESKGTAVRKSIMGGRYVMGDYNGQMQMPGADGKVQRMEFHGHGIDGYDNVKKKFVSTWIDNMGTSIMEIYGDYDPGSKTITYTGEEEMVPGMQTKVRQVIKLTDKDHMGFEWYEDRGGQEAKVMEIQYTRKK
jgi:Protein of unknown function (DUF1579)